MAVSGQVSLSAPLEMTDAARDEFEVAVREHAKFVYKVVYSVLRNHHDAEDAAQETFLRLLRQQKKWPEIRDRRAWLARTAWRVALDRRKPTPEVALDEVAKAVLELRDQGAGADEIASTEQMKNLLGRLIAALPQDLRDAVALSTAEEMTSVEISEVLGIPEGSVRTRLMRAREILRQKLAAILERKHES
ncbi:MAG: RNA polymerase sigma factor [Terriglobia bacterium]